MADDDTAERILKRLLRRRNEVEFCLGEGWALDPAYRLWSFVPETDADLAYLTELIDDFNEGYDDPNEYTHEQIAAVPVGVVARLCCGMAEHLKETS